MKDWNLNKNVLKFIRNHYAQHQQSVEAARRGASARLENFDGNTQQIISPSDDICGLCER